jgi:hypothetical protein
VYFLGGKSTIQDTCHGFSMTTYYLTMTIHNHFDDCLRLTYSNISMFYIFMYNLLKWKKKLKRPFYLFDQTMFIKIVYHNISRSSENYIPQYVLCLLRQFNMFNQFGGKYVNIWYSLTVLNFEHGHTHMNHRHSISGHPSITKTSLYIILSFFLYW